MCVCLFLELYIIRMVNNNINIYWDYYENKRAKSIDKEEN
jgi:hypothetical protein